MKKIIRNTSHNIFPTIRFLFGPMQFLIFVGHHVYSDEHFPHLDATVYLSHHVFRPHHEGGSADYLF